MVKQLLTHSRMSAFKECRRKAFYTYELGLRRIDDAKALRMGSAFHGGIEHLGAGLEAACSAVRQHYTPMPEAFDPYWWAIECETILRLVCGYQWRWQNAGLEVIATEQSFQVPLTNPSTGAETPIFDLAGKIDGIVRLEDGRLAVKETKTCSEDLGSDSDYWRRLRIDSQISTYIIAARKLGYDVKTVLYDVIRKPSIQPTPVPMLDGNGLKIVLDEFGERVMTKQGKPRQTASVEDRFTLQTRPMTPTEWGEKLSADIAERPDFYFARREVPRLDQDIDEHAIELWDLQRTIREAQLSGRWFRTVTRNTCPYCEHFDHCSTNQAIDNRNPPVGFEIVSDLHPELERESNVNVNATSTESGAAASAASTAAV